MKVTDLMVGDWVYMGNPVTDELVPTKVANIYGEEINCKTGHTNDDVPTILSGKWLRYAQPIPLTEDILVKNGFSEIHHPGTGATDEYSEWFFGGIKIIEWLEDWKYHYFSAGGDGAPIDFQYVHQLQHLLRLCGIDKEIEL